MGKPMGRHLIPITYSQKPKKGPKRGTRSRDLRFVLHSSFDRLSKSQNLVKGQQAANIHMWLVPSHSGLISTALNASSLAQAS
jgi:hypothetical protein